MLMKQVRSSIALLCVFLGLTALLAMVVSLVRADSFTLTIKKVGQGTVVADPLPPYVENQLVTLTATADPGWEFVSWAEEGAQSDWWDNQWGYRVPITVAANGFQRQNKPAGVDINFNALITSLGATGSLDPNSIRVVEVDQAGNVIDEDVAFQFDVKQNLNEQWTPGNLQPPPACSTSVPGSGRVTLIVKGTTAANAERHYHVYFDVLGKNIPAKNVPPQITFTDDVIDPPAPDPGRQASFKVQTQAGTYFYHKKGAGFSSLDDANGNDWIGFEGTPGSGFAGEYRGIPNLVLPNNGGLFHPGTKNKDLNTCLISTGPLKTTIYSIYRKNNNERWLVTWEIYPTYANMTLLVARYDYWFLYEGTPGGSLQVNKDFIVRSDGTQTLLSQTWSTALAPEQWVFVADPDVGRSLFAAQHDPDAIKDWYTVGGDNLMTVFGFGRENAKSLIPKTQVPEQFTIGLIDTTTYDDAAPLIRSAYKDLQTTIGVAELYGGGGSLGDTNPVQVTITGDKIVTATFAAQTYELNLTADGVGSVTKNPDKAVYNYNEQVVITATPDSADWGFVGWQGDIAGITPSLSPQTVTMTADRDIVAKFAPIYDIDTAVIGQGAIALDPDKPQYFSGDEVAVTAIPAPGWSFANWSGSITGTDNPQTVSVNGNLTITGTFTQDAYTLTVSHIGNGTTDYTPQQSTYLYGDVVTLTATPDSGNVFMGWTGDITSSEATTQVTITGNTAVVANFAEVSFRTLNLQVTGQGSAEADPDQTHYQNGEIITLTATPAIGWAFTGWTGDLISTTSPIQVVMDADKTITANFAPDGPYTLSVQTEGQGTVTKAPDQTDYDAGTEVMLTPNPAGGWIFAGWKGDLTGSASPAKVVMDKSKTITAVFVEQSTSGPSSDNFDDCVLAGKWEFVNPLGDGSYKVNGRQLELSVPADTVHNVFTTGNDSARVMQTTENEDFTVEVKFDSRLEQSGAMQGIIVEQDAGSFMRFDFFRREDTITVYAAAFVLPATDPVLSFGKVTLAPMDTPLSMRVVRFGDNWELLYSFDGSQWNPAYEFEHTLIVQQIGVFSGNFKVKGIVPAHTAVVDYFYNALDPNKPADRPLLTVDVVGNGQVERNAQAPYICGQSVTLTAKPSGGATFAGWSGDANGTQSPLPVILNTRKSVTATFTGGTAMIKLALPVILRP